MIDIEHMNDGPYIVLIGSVGLHETFFMILRIF